VKTFDIVIPAANEASTIAPVIDAALRARGVGEVIVVDDHSEDETAAVASRSGARVVFSNGRREKAKAMATGVAASSAQVLVFFDGDILHVRPEHFEALAEPVVEKFSMCCGLVDYGRLRNPLFLRLPPITGLRAVRREVFEAIPPGRLNGFQIEIMINEVIARGGLPTAIRVLTGIAHRSKVQKEGLMKGIRSHTRMTVELLSCFTFVPLWTYRSYLQSLEILPPVGSVSSHESEEAA